MSELRELIEKETSKYAKRFYKTLLNEGYELVNGSRYVKSAIHVEIRCNKGHEYKTTPKNFREGYRCRRCSNLKRMDKHSQEFDKLLNKEGYKLANNSIYKNAHQNITLQCGKGHLFNIRPNNFKNGGRCYKCFNENRKFTHNEFVEQIYTLRKESYKVIGEYIDSHTKVEILHVECGYTWDVFPYSFKNGSECPKCTRLNRIKTTKEFKEDVYGLCGNEYTVIGEYTTYKDEILMKHELCKNEFKITPNSFMANSRCPECSSSMGEQTVARYLTDNNILYKFQHTFDDLRHKELLKLDFYLPQHNLIIEFDGEGHYYSIDWAGRGEEWAKQHLKGVQLRDQIKNEYAEDNGINLLRIPYWDIDNVEEIITDKLNELTETLEVL